MLRSQSNWAAAIAMQSGVVPMIYGSPGTAKTAFFRALASSANRRFLQVILRQKMPEDLGGVPVPSDIPIGNKKICDDCQGTGKWVEDGVTNCGWCKGDGLVDGAAIIRGVTHLLPEDMLRAKHEPTLLLLDEFNHAGHDVMGAAQEWVNNPPPNCWMAACSNPVEQSTSGVELSPPVVNRMCVLQWERPVAARREGWRSGFVSYPAPDVPIVPANYLQQFGQNWGNLLCEFEDKLPHLFGEQAFPKDVNKASDPWPSDRSWTNVGILMAACDAVWASAGTRAKLVYGCVGDGAGNEFLEFVGHQDLPNPEDLLARPDQLVLPQRFDLVRAIIGSVLNAVRENNTPQRWEKCYDFLECVYDQNPEAAMSAEGATWKIKPAGHEPRARNGRASEMRKLRLGA